MSEDLNNNERYLKELADKHLSVPPPMVWDEIEQVLDKDKGKRRSILMLWLFGVLLLGAIIFINLKGKKDKESPIVDQDKIINDYQKQSDPNPKDIRTSEIETINEVKQEQNANFSETIPTISENQEEKKLDSENHKSFVTHKHHLNNLNASSVIRSLIANTNTFNSNETTVTTKEDIFRPKISTHPTLEDRNIIQITSFEKLNSIWRLIDIRPLPDPTEKFTTIVLSESKHNAALSTPWFLELGGGIGRNLSNPVLINPSQGAFRLNTESKWYSWSTSFQLGYQFDNLWYTTIGFDLNQTKNRFDFWRRDVSSLEIGENQSLQITNRDFFNIGEIIYTFADVGLFIGKRANINKWHFSLEGGAIFNVLFNANGKVQVGGLEFSRLEDQDEYFNTSIGIGARLSAMLDFPISDQLWISVGPNYHQYFNRVSSDENPLEERNAILQVKARARYHF